MSVADEFRRPRDSNERRPARSSIDGFTRHQARQAPHSSTHAAGAGAGAVPDHAAVVAAASEATRGCQTNALGALNVLLSTVRRMSQNSLPSVIDHSSLKSLELEAQDAIDQDALQRCLRITHRCHQATTAFFDRCRAAHTPASGPLKQHNLQGVALRRTRRVDGVSGGRPVFARRRPSAAHRNAPPWRRRGLVRRLLGVPDRVRRLSERRAGRRQRCLDVPVRERSRSGDGSLTRRGAGVVEALEPSTGVSGARQPCGPVDRPTAKDGGETGKAVCTEARHLPVDAAADLDVIWMPGGRSSDGTVERGRQNRMTTIAYIGIGPRSQSRKSRLRLNAAIEHMPPLARGRLTSSTAGGAITRAARGAAFSTARGPGGRRRRHRRDDGVGANIVLRLGGFRERGSS